MNWILVVWFVFLLMILMSMIICIEFVGTFHYGLNTTSILRDRFCNDDEP